MSGTCFGCGQDNPRGLGLGSKYEIEDNEIVVRASIDEAFAGFTGVVHGGIVAAVLDEAMGFHITYVQEMTHVMTADLRIEFLAPVATETPIEVRARSRRDGRKFHGEAEIRGGEGTVLARATSLWIDAGPRAQSAD